MYDVNVFIADLVDVASGLSRTVWPVPVRSKQHSSKRSLHSVEFGGGSMSGNSVKQPFLSSHVTWLWKSVHYLIYNLRRL